MFYYLKLRKKGTLNWKALREDGKILVFNKYETAKRYTDDLGDYVCEIITISCHPMHKQSPIYRRKYKKVGW